MLTALDLRGFRGELRNALPRPNLAGEGPVGEVRAIIAEVRAHGDAAVRELTRRFDGVELGELRVPHGRLAEALDRIPSALRDALTQAHDSIEAFHRHCLRATPLYERDGVIIEDISRPVERAGLYVPGGRAEYPSTVLMTAVPARVAGVSQVAMCVPPRPDGSVADSLLAAAELAGVDEVYRVGGAQAIAAFAYGTESVPRVDVIAGPGNRWVSIAQREVAAVVRIPASFAGPSEVVVIADRTTPVQYAAVDIVVQAEHGPDGLAWLITWDPATAAGVSAAVAELVAESPRRREIEATLATGGHAVLVDGPEQAMAVANEIAPEHLELCNEDPESLIPLVRNAGAVFVGPYAPASVGDYIAGPSHVLPTFGSARYASGLGVDDFVKRSHAVTLDRRTLERLAPAVEILAETEGLPAHALSVRVRCEQAVPSSS